MSSNRRRTVCVSVDNQFKARLGLSAQKPEGVRTPYSVPRLDMIATVSLLTDIPWIWDPFALLITGQSVDQGDEAEEGEGGSAMTSSLATVFSADLSPARS